MEKKMKGLKVGLMVGLISLMATPAFARVDQSEGSWNGSLDLHHYWSHYRPSSVDPGSHSLLQLHRYHHGHGFQER